MALLFAGLFAVLSADAKSPQGTKPDFRSADAEFHYTGIFGEQQRLIVYYPDGWSAEKKIPCVLFFHGGGWAGGDLSMFQYFCDYFSSRGLVAISANYKLCPKELRADLPEGTSHKRWGVMDAKSCIRWVKANAEMLGVDPEKIVLSGGSAGGHIATMALLDEEFNNDGDPELDTNVAALMLFNPAYTVLNKEPIPDVNVFKKLKPVLPPSIIFYGSEDGWKTSNFDLLSPKLKEQGTVFEEWVAPGQGHAFFNTVPWCHLVLVKSDEFLVSLGLMNGRSAFDPPATGDVLIKGNQ